jgi:hypothetical protein
MSRLKPEQIQAGKSYRLMPRYSYIPGLNLIRRVEEIRGDKVVVMVGEKEVIMPVREFAALAVEEVAERGGDGDACPKSVQRDRRD